MDTNTDTNHSSYIEKNNPGFRIYVVTINYNRGSSQFLYLSEAEAEAKFAEETKDPPDFVEDVTVQEAFPGEDYQDNDNLLEWFR